MPINIVFSDDDVRYLNEGAAIELPIKVKKFGIDLIKAAGQIEANLNSAPGTPEITKAMLADADSLIRHRFNKPRRKPIDIIAKVSSALGGVFLGILGSADLTKPNNMIPFIIILVVTLASVIFLLVKE